MDIDLGTCDRCKKRKATRSLQHPDCGIDFGHMGSMSLCAPCDRIVSDELQQEIDDSGIQDEYHDWRDDI